MLTFAVVEVLRNAELCPVGGVDVGGAVAVDPERGQRVGAGDVGEQFGGLLLQLRAAQLEQRRRRVRLAVGRRRDHAQLGHLQGEQVVLQPGDAGGELRIVEQGAGGGLDLAGQFLGLGQFDLGLGDAGDADALVAEQELACVQPGSPRRPSARRVHAHPRRTPR